MLSVLINAYACSPNMGSEPGMAWNWCVNLANHCELHIITEGEFRDNIESALPLIPQGKNMHFYYNPVSEEIRKMCWNQGDWRFYKYYREWQYKTLQIAKSIIQEHQIDIIHQLNMIGFREPGFLWKIENIPFIWGPIGGLMDIPLNYIALQNVKRKIIAYLKTTLNVLQVKYHPRVKKALQKSSFIIGAARESVEKIERYYGKKVILINEAGCYIKNTCADRTDEDDGIFHIVWVGRFLYTKKLDLALRTISKLNHLKNIKFHIVGSGNEKDVESYKRLENALNINDVCVWHGNVSHATVQNIMQKSDILFFTSIAEGTPHVVLEAINNCLPVVCFDCCGHGDSVNEEVGLKIKLSNPQQSIDEFAANIEYLYHNRDILLEKSKNCIGRQKELSWGNKATQMVYLYRKAIEIFNNHQV